MSIALLPPLNRRVANLTYDDRSQALTEGPAYILGRPSTRYEPRWHRVRAGERLDTVDGHERTYWHVWCGPHHNAAHVVAVDELPEGQPLCGTCDGRAKGHLGESGLVYSPDLLKAPKLCPSKTLYSRFGHNVGRCLACGEFAALRWAPMHSGYSGREVITTHPPKLLVPPCPFHAWRSLVADGSTARCACGQNWPTTCPDTIDPTTAGA